jgi:hypothetical protein
VAVALGRAYIDMFVEVRFECRRESSVYRSLANSTNNGGTIVYVCFSLCVCVCGVFLLDLMKFGKHFCPHDRQQNFMDKTKCLSPNDDISTNSSAVFTPAVASCTSLFRLSFNLTSFPPTNPKRGFIQEKHTKVFQSPLQQTQLLTFFICLLHVSTSADHSQ